MGTDTTTIDGMLKRVYTKDAIIDITNKEVKTISQIKKSSLKIGGQGGWFPVTIEGNERGQGSQNELESLRTPNSQVPKQAYVLPKIFTHTIRFSGLSLEVADTDDESFVNNLTYQTDQGIKDSLKEENCQLFRDGSGKIAQVNGAVTTSSTVTFDNGCPTHFRAGMYVDVINAGSTKQIDSIKVTGVNITNSQITLASNQSCDDDSWIYREDTADNAPTDGKEFAGLKLMVDDGTLLATYQGISRTTYNQWDGLSIATGGVNLSDDILQRAAAQVMVYSGRSVKKIISNTSQFRKYLSILTPAKEYRVGDKMDSGYKVMPTWNGLEWMVDTDCQFDRVYMYDPDYVEISEIHPLKLDDKTGSVFRWDSGYDAFVVVLKHYANFVCRNPKSLIALTGLATPTF